MKKLLLIMFIVPSIAFGGADTSKTWGTTTVLNKWGDKTNHKIMEYEQFKLNSDYETTIEAHNIAIYSNIIFPISKDEFVLNLYFKNMYSFNRNDKIKVSMRLDKKEIFEPEHLDKINPLRQDDVTGKIFGGDSFVQIILTNDYMEKIAKGRQLDVLVQLGDKKEVRKIYLKGFMKSMTTMKKSFESILM